MKKYIFLGGEKIYVYLSILKYIKIYLKNIMDTFKAYSQNLRRIIPVCTTFKVIHKLLNHSCR